jgi:hypothetical protein
MRWLRSLKPAVPCEAKAPDSFSRTVPVRASTLNIRKTVRKPLFLRGLGGDRGLGA